MMEMETKLRSQLKRALPGKVLFQERFARHTTFRIGGKAEVWANPTRLGEVKWLVKFCRMRKIPILVVGHGSNILARDEGIGGVVISLDGGYFGRISVINNEILAGAAVSLGRLLKTACTHSLGGCEFLAGIPGTVGGALVMNTGIVFRGRNSRTRRDISEIVREVELIDCLGENQRLGRAEIDFGYRESSLAGGIVVRARFHLRRKKRSEIERRLRDYLNLRKRSLALEYPSAGCIFKNPLHSSLSSAALIERCGLKGRRWGNAMVSERHANFIVNLGKAKAGDVLKLMDLVQREVKKVYGISLTPEIKVIG